ncbi:hypothetical protein [Micromonospora sp. NBC_01796]|uniref:hypothetical protein n=1 Tax=Micromonospora sp. NBC_01796 TaxID=2975987 RepID=UPI002DDB6063|nr:hypothetical protein [Micromonospora sp. NBC_01796]WSA87514.1 hypothetical protein OIE47_07850 [Micromonospora sp. NBC_01796]
MSTQSGSTAVSPPDRSATTTAAPTPDGGTTPPTYAPAALGLGVLAIGWLAAMLWIGQAEITSSDINSIVIAMAALALPGLISASMVGGAAAAVVAANLLTRRGVHRSTPRFAAAVGAGLLVGLLAALTVTLSYGDGDSITVLAGTVAAAATVGGIAGGVRAVPVVGAVVAAGLTVFVINTALNIFKDPLLSLYGYGDTDQSQTNALEWFSRTGSIGGGLVAGLLVFFYLGLARRRTLALNPRASLPRWPAYLVAGAGPGLLLLAAELLTQTAGARLLAAAGSLSEVDRGLQDQLSEYRSNQALWVLFVGALTALIAFGRTLRPAGAEPEDETATEFTDEVEVEDRVADEDGISDEDPVAGERLDPDDDEIGWDDEGGTDKRSADRRPDTARS